MNLWGEPSANSGSRNSKVLQKRCRPPRVRFAPRHGVSLCHLLDQRDWNLGQVDNLRGDRAQNVFLTSYLRYHFGRLSGFGERLKGDAGTFGFSYRVLQRLGRCL